MNLSWPECCNGGGAGNGEDAQVYSPSRVSRISLNLSRPYHRAILRLNYKRCARLGVSPMDAFIDVHSSPAGYTHPGSADKFGVYDVPTHGVVAMTYALEVVMEKMMT